MRLVTKFRELIPEDGVVRVGLGVGIAGVVIQGLVVLVFWGRLPPEVPLFYSMPYGVQQLADRYWLWLLPGLGLVFWLVNWLVSRTIQTSYVLVSQMGAWVTNVVIGLLLIALIYSLILVL